MAKNDLNLIEKYVCAPYDPHNRFHMNDVNRLRLLFTKSSDNKLQHLRSAYAAGCIWGVTWQPSDQNTISFVDWGRAYSKDNRFAVDWCGAYNANLNDYKFACTCKGLCSRSKCVEKDLSRQQNKISLYCIIVVL